MIALGWLAGVNPSLGWRNISFGGDNLFFFSFNRHLFFFGIVSRGRGGSSKRDDLLYRTQHESSS